jgi:hypothetical protein
MATDANWCAVDRYVTVESGKIEVLGLVGIVTEDRRGTKNGKNKGRVQIEYSAPAGARQVKTAWYYPGSLVDGSAHEQAYKDAKKAGKLYRLKGEGEGEESDEASSDDEAPAQLAVGDRVLMDGRSGVIVALPDVMTGEGKSTWWKLRLDGEEAVKTARRGQFLRMGEQPPPPPPPPRRSTRDGAGQLKEERKRCGECDACLSMVRPPPGCDCAACQKKDSKGTFTSTCNVVRKAQGDGPACEKWPKDDEPEIGEDECGSARCGDPVTRERRKLQDIAELIRENSDADVKKLAADSMPGHKTIRGITALFSVATPGMPSQIDYVIKLLGEDATTADLGEHLAAHLKECDYLDDDKETRNEMIRLARAAAVAPDVETEPPANRLSMLRRAWLRIANALYRQQRDEILALPKGSEALRTWLRTRAQFAVEKRREQGQIAGALAEVTLDAARKALRTGLMFREKSKGERYNNVEPFRLARNEFGRTDVTDYNNVEPFRLARNEFGRTDVTDNVKRLRETGPPPPSARKEKK